MSHEYSVQGRTLLDPGHTRSAVWDRMKNQALWKANAHKVSKARTDFPEDVMGLV